jgi:hypothetical protein
MKKLIILIAIALFSGTMHAQASAIPGAHVATPPQPVATAFSTRFPGARLKKWYQTPDRFIAQFKLNGKKLFADFGTDGSWQKTQTAIHWSWNLPEKVRNGWRHCDFAAWYLADIKLVETPDGRLYALHVNNSPIVGAEHAEIDHSEYELFFNENGELVRKFER